MATFTDSKGREWDLVFTVPKFIKVCRKLKLKLNQLLSMDVELADLVESLPLILEKQLKERGIPATQFFEELSGDDVTAAMQAFMEMVAEAFPEASKENQGGPFVHGS